MSDGQPLAIVAGTGFATLAPLADAQEQSVGTAYGTARLVRGTWHGLPIAFLPRHGAGHATPPHLVNYRANLAALRDIGCHDVIAVNVVGGIDPALTPGTLVCVDDFLDFTKTRQGTFHEGALGGGVVHVDVSEAYSPPLRAEILAAADAAGRAMHDGGVYACFEGPRFESPAEIRMARTLGADVVGMTGVPEVTLAVEAGMAYAAISLVVNPAAGLASGPIAMDGLDQALAASVDDVLAVLDAIVRRRVASAPAAGLIPRDITPARDVPVVDEGVGRR